MSVHANTSAVSSRELHVSQGVLYATSAPDGWVAQPQTTVAGALLSEGVLAVTYPEPTDYEQYMLELVNRARQDPWAEAVRYGIDLNQNLAAGTISYDAKQPLAMNSLLITSARTHSQWMLDNDVFSHTGANNSTPAERMTDAGYYFNPYYYWTSGENIAWQGTTGSLPTDLTEYIEDHHEGLFKSAGHRVNILEEDYRELGIGQKTGYFSTTTGNYQASMVTQNFAASGNEIFLSGVVFQDENGNDFYTPGEGWGNVIVSIPALGLETQTWGSGGYQLAVPVGTYMVEFSGGVLPGVASTYVTVSDQNVKLDISPEAYWTSWYDYNGYIPPEEDGVFTLYSSILNTPVDLLKQITGNTYGLSLGSVNYIGAEGAVSFFDSINFGPGVYMNSPGILLTSGDGSPALQNTSSGYAVGNYTPGDAMFDDIAHQAFSGAGNTNDASILEFSFNVTNPTIKSVSFDVIFGSDEYPEWVDSSFVDIAAISVNGVNYALFDGDPLKPLSIVGNNIASGSLFDNQYSYEGTSPYSIEYDGISPRITISIPVAMDGVYDVRLGVADTGDSSLDSGIFISNFRSNYSSAVDGALVEVTSPDPSTGIYMPASPITATKFIGGSGNNTFVGSTAADTYDISSGNTDNIQGTAQQLNGDTVIGFTTSDTLLLQNAFFNPSQMQVTWGSAILDIDTDGDGQYDTNIKLDGTYNHGSFYTENTAEGTAIKFKIDAAPPSQDYNGLNLIDSFLDNSGVGLSSVMKNVIATRLQNVINAGFDKDSNIAIVLAANPIIRATVPEGQNVIKHLQGVVGAAKNDLGGFISIDVNDLSMNNASDGNFVYNFAFESGSKFANFINFSKGDKLDFSQWTATATPDISFSLSGSTELSYQVGDLENFSSVWAGSLGNMDADLVSQVFEKQTVAEQIGVLNAAWGNDWLIL